MPDDRLFDLLEHWETERDLGREIAPEALAPDDPALADQLESWIHRLRATEWLRAPLAERSKHPAETARTNSDRTRLERRPRAGDRQRFLTWLAASGLLDEAACSAIDVDEPFATLTEADQLAAALVAGGQLTEYQAQSLLRGDPGRLILGNYVVQKLLGSGGMGDVFLARHRVMDRLVALKVLPAAAGRRPDAVARFHREVRALARLSHPHIVTAHDADEDRGVHFLVMEYVAGEDLATLVSRRGPLPLQEAAEYIRQAALGLAYAHAQGLIHRDVKPSNLMLQSRDQWSRSADKAPSSMFNVPGSDGIDPTLNFELGTSNSVVKVLDLGLASACEDFGGPESLTRTGAILGTVDFLAPEQSFDPSHVDVRADIYSLGCTLYYLLTGRAVFSGRTLGEKLLAHRDEAPQLFPLPLGEGQGEGRGIGVLPARRIGVPPVPEESGAGSQEPEVRNHESLSLPDSLLDLLSSLLAKSPASRPASMSAVATALEQILRSEPPFLPIPVGEGRGEGLPSSPPPSVTPSLPLYQNSSLRIPHSAFSLLSRRHVLIAVSTLPALGLAGWGAFAIWKHIARGTIEISISQSGIQSAEIFVDHQPHTHWRASDGRVRSLQLPVGTHEVRIVAPGYYHSVHDIVVAMGRPHVIVPKFTPAPRWKLIQTQVKNDVFYRLALVGGPWDGYQLRLRGAAENPQRNMVVLDNLPTDYGLWRIERQPDGSTAFISAHGFQVHFCLNAGEYLESSHVIMAFVELDLTHRAHWQTYDLAPNEIIIERRTIAHMGLFLGPPHLEPSHQRNPDGKRNFSANPAMIRMRPLSD